MVLLLVCKMIMACCLCSLFDVLHKIFTFLEVNSKILLKGRQAALLGVAKAPVVANDAKKRRRFEKY